MGLYFPRRVPAMLKASKYSSVIAFYEKLKRRFFSEMNLKLVIEIGGSTGNNVQHLFPDSEYYNIDLKDSSDIPTIVADVSSCIPITDVDLVFSNDCLEHVKKPWLAAQNIEKCLKPGGICFISTIFSWRYHPVPEDYWRFSPAGLEALFENLICLGTNFGIKQRRNDIRGFWDNKKDAVPIDELGGWRENWRAWYLGKKPAMNNASLALET